MDCGAPLPCFVLSQTSAFNPSLFFTVVHTPVKMAVINKMYRKKQGAAAGARHVGPSQAAAAAGASCAC